MKRARILALLLAGALLPATAQSNRYAKKLGDYLVEAGRINANCGIEITHRILYKDRLVSETSYAAFVSPYNPSRIMYSVSPSCPGPEERVGTFYFEPSRKRPVKVRVLPTDAPLEELDTMWSPDDRFAALSSSQAELALVNLQTGKSTNLSNHLYLAGSVMSNVIFRGWSPDGKRTALVVSSFVDRGGRLRTESDLISFDPASLTPTYLATMRKAAGWSAGEFTWVKSTSCFELVVDPAIRDSAAVYLKPGGLAFHPLSDRY